MLILSSCYVQVADKAATSPPGQMVLDEEEARFYFTQFVDAMAYCHAHGIAHRCYAHAGVLCTPLPLDCTAVGGTTCTAQTASRRCCLTVTASAPQPPAVRRDLKLDNALLDSSRPAVLKLCDFGFARTFGAAGARLERVNSHLGCASWSVGRPERLPARLLD